jgi:hypothetical protein
MRIELAVVVGAVMASCLAGAGVAGAQGTPLAVQDGDTVRSVLERHVGKRVALVMQNGPELNGVVVKVGERVVHLGELGGREFFDAAVSLDRIDAVVVRVRGGR